MGPEHAVSSQEMPVFEGLLKQEMWHPVGWASDSGSGHDLAVREVEPRVGLCADGSEPGADLDSGSPSVSAPPPLMLCLSLSQK